MNSGLPDKYQNDLAVLEAVKIQTEKDFRMAGFEMDTSGWNCTDFYRMSESLENSLGKLGLTPGELSNIMYRIDVPDTWLSGEGKPAFLILKRELLKVITRKIYNPGADNKGSGS